MWPFRRKEKGPPRERGKGSHQGWGGSSSELNPIPVPQTVTDTLDLHGFFPEQVPVIIRDFIANARDLGLRRLRVVHGKGKSRLKWEVHRALRDSPEVEKFGDAPPEGGGWGATVVLLRKQRNEP